MQTPTDTVGSRMDTNSGIGPGFDTLRLVLSIAVLCWHSIPLCYGSAVEQSVWTSPVGRPFMAIMPVFFALSGFLVAGSAQRMASVTPFILSRGLRIFPALITEVVLSALLIGGLFTTIPLVKFYSDSMFFQYFGSLIGKVAPQLPGVFANNPYAGMVNNNLWTIPPEILCYLFMAIIMVVGLSKGKWGVTIASLVLTVLNVSYDLRVGFEAMDARWPARYLVLAFAYGGALFMWRHALPYRRDLMAACLLVGLATLRAPLSIYLGIIALTYVMAYLGVTKLWTIPVLERGDYSYGIYLYSFPMQQVVIHIFPGTKEFYWNILLALPLSIAFAMFSWHVIEKPALSFRRRLKRFNDIAPTTPLMCFAVLAALIAYAAFLLRFSFIAFSEPISLPVALKYSLIVLSTAAICVAAKFAVQRAERWAMRPAA